MWLRADDQLGNGRGRRWKLTSRNRRPAGDPLRCPLQRHLVTSSRRHRALAATGSTGMADLAQWLTSLPLGVVMRRHGWLFPLLQTLHILATGLVMSATIMISLRLWRVSKTQSIGARSHRYLPWIWW